MTKKNVLIAVAVAVALWVLPYFRKGSVTAEIIGWNHDGYFDP